MGNFGGIVVGLVSDDGDCFCDRDYLLSGEINCSLDIINPYEND
jgi:hypothetical protein